MTQRAPLITRIEARQYPIELLTWIAKSPPSGPQIVIPRQSDWPNPVRRVINFDLLTWTNRGVQPSGPQIVIPRQADWQNPILRIPDLRLNTWISSPQASPASTFKQTDWPNPIRRIENLELRTWINQGITPSGPQIVLQRQQDWQNPVQRIANLELRTWIQAPQSPPIQPPTNQYNWPNPIHRIANLELRTWTAQAPPSGPQVVLNRQQDWPNPPSLLPNLELRSWIQVPAVVAPSLQIVQSDWQNPTLPVVNYNLYTWIQSPLAGTQQPVIDQQFSGGWPYFYDYIWERSARKRKLEEARRAEESIEEEIDRNIARLLHQQQAKDEERQDLERIRLLVRQYKEVAPIDISSERVLQAIDDVKRKENRASLEKLQREFERMIEEEEQALIIFLNDYFN